MTTTHSMRALVVHASGGMFEEVQLPRPTPGKGEVLVRIHASGVNPLDTKIRAGEAAHARHPFPAVLGMDLAGVVESVGADVETFRVGDEVYGLTGGVAGLQSGGRARLCRAVRHRLDDRHGCAVDGDRGAAAGFRALADLGQSRPARRGRIGYHGDRRHDDRRNNLCLKE